MFENQKTSVGIHYSRYIASWYNKGGEPYRDQFKRWLKSLGHLTEDEISDITEMAFNGKMELETSVKAFLNK